MMSGRDNKPHQISTTISDQEEQPDSRIDSSTAFQKQSKRNLSKRSKEGDDSFEVEHRLVNVRNQYFNNSNSHIEASTTTSRSTVNVTNSTSPRPSFPPFRITFAADDSPSELSIIKYTNKHCRISLSYGRYSKMGRNKSFLLYANSSEQFDRLMDKNIWPIQICSLDFSIDFPSKVPSCYSIVAIGVPTQWNLTEFQLDIKKQCPTIIKVERLYIRGGIPISKVRIGFSSNQEVNKIIKNKRLLLDDDNTSFVIQPYSPPLRILRCFNCQQYNDHIAANCPHKDNPICFRCGQNHPYNPHCINKICCANCHQDHMVGNPNCPKKIEERSKYQNSISTSINNKPKQDNLSSVWTTNQPKRNTPIRLSSSIENVQETFDKSVILDISKKLDLLMTKIELFSTEQVKINSSLNNMNQLINSCYKEVNLMKEFPMNSVCPFVCELSDAFLGKSKQVEKDRLRPLLVKFKQDFKEATKSTVLDTRSNAILPNSSPNESISEDF
ncbi:unnamed protein product [Rotaria sp. Silwood2]|nr:unnamed protein product [Rotaria sp. Silwood2]